MRRAYIITRERYSIFQAKVDSRDTKEKSLRVWPREIRKKIYEISLTSEKDKT